MAKVRGVQDVQNEIIQMSPSTADNRLRNALAQQIFNSIHFQRFASYKNPPFRILVDRSVVILVGYVQGEIERREMENIARQTFGVLRVHNQLQTMQ